VLLFATLTSIIAATTPAWESADEPGHVRNIETLVQGRLYGIDAHCTVSRQAGPDALLSCAGDEAHQAPLYYFAMAGWQDLIGLQARYPPRTVASAVGSAHRGDHGFLIWLRFPNVLLGAITVVMAFCVTRLIVRDSWTPVLAAALVATFPQFVFESSFVTNDNLANTLGAVLVFCAVKCVTLKFSLRWIALTGVTFGLLIDTKISTLLLGLIIPVVALMAPGWRSRLSLLAYGVIAALVASSWYLIQNWVRYGDPLARQASSRYLAKVGGLATSPGIPYTVRQPLHLILVDVPYRILRTIWYESGAGLFHWPTWISVVITCVIGAILLGLIGQHYSGEILTVLITISVSALASVWLIAFQTASYSSRYALVGVGGVATLVALALQRWSMSLRWLLPIAALFGCCVAIDQNIFNASWI